MKTATMVRLRPWAGIVATLIITGGLAAAAPVLAQGQAAKQTFVGTITDDTCANANHSSMRMGSNDAECATACVEAHGANWVLFDGKAAHVVSDQKMAATFAAKKVRVVGTVDPKTKRLVVESMRAEP